MSEILANRWTAVATVAAVAAIGLPVQWMRSDTGWTLAAVGVILGVVVAAAIIRSRPAVRTAVVAVILTIPVLAFGPVGWPLPLAVAPVALWALGRVLPAARPSRPWFRMGRMTPDLPWLTLATVVVSGAALLVWALLARPEPGVYLGTLRDESALLAIAGIAAFSLVNAACEEVVFRGILQTELTTVVGTWPAVAVQAVVFGLLHITGFPSGLTGVALATVYGGLVGVLRVRSDGLMAPYIAHVAADVTIGVVVVAVL